MRPQSLLILTAVMIEAKAVAKALDMPVPKPGTTTQRKCGELCITLGIIGVSAKFLPDRTADFVVMAGLAGALDGGLRIADLIVDDWGEGVQIPQGAKRCKIHSAVQIAATPAEKAALFSQTQCSAVDMENNIVRQWAERCGVQFCAIRSISDRADQSLDPAVLKFVDPWGRPKILPLLRSLLLRPSLLPHLMRLAANSKKAAKRLGEAVRELVESIAL